MKEDLNKPLYEDYLRQKGYRIWGKAISGEKSYKLADRPLVVIGWVLIIIAIGVIGYLSPFAETYPGNFFIVIVCLIILFIATFLYKCKFVYRFGRFRVTWEDTEEHFGEEASSRCDEKGKFLKTEENRKAARNSRRAFLVLFAAIIAVVLMYCFLWIGLSYLRVYSWRMGEIEEVKQIAQKYDSVFVGGGVSGAIKDGKADISEQEMQRLWDILDSMKWDYVSFIQIYNRTGEIHIGFHTVFGYSCLVWYEDADSLVERFADTVIQIDEHWFYMRMDDGSRLY